MKTITLNIYSFDELSEDAKQTALQNYTPFTDFIYTDAKQTVIEFCKAFNVEASSSSWLDFNYHNNDNATEILKGLRLRKYIINNFDDVLHKGKYYGKITKNERHIFRHSKVLKERCCNLTGVCYDLDILKPIYSFIDNPTEDKNIDDIFNECFKSLSTSIYKEIEYRNSDEGKTEDLEGNDTEYFENGSEV